MHYASVYWTDIEYVISFVLRFCITYKSNWSDVPHILWIYILMILMYNKLYHPAYAHTPSDVSYVRVIVNFL